MQPSAGPVQNRVSTPVLGKVRHHPTSRSEGDPDRAALACVLGAWGRLDPKGKGQTLKSILGLLYASREDGEPVGFDDVREALEFLAPGHKGGVDARQLGAALRRLRGRWVGGCRLVSEPTASGVARWRVERQGGGVETEPAASQAEPWSGD